jgi:alkylhydroperoxidase/carboxymuconolactone decarboxylase family protein YurZ
VTDLLAPDELTANLAAVRARFVECGACPPALDPRTAELIQLAVHAHVSLLNQERIEAHIGRAIDAGASVSELVETLVLTSAVGSHSLAVGVPILLEELAAVGLAPEETPLEAQRQRTRDRFTGSPVRPRTWAPMWDAVLRADPDYFAALAAYLDAPWQHGTLGAVTKEFIYIAVDVTATHLFPSGLRGHIRSALELGASPAQIIAVMQVASTVADLSCAIGLPLVAMATSRSTAQGTRA